MSNVRFRHTIRFNVERAELGPVLEQCEEDGWELVQVLVALHEAGPFAQYDPVAPRSHDDDGR